MFPGLIPILNSYLENMEVDVDTRCSILNYLKLIKKRASGIVIFFPFSLFSLFTVFNSVTCLTVYHTLAMLIFFNI